MDKATRQALIAQYKDGPRVIEEALAGITEVELDARPAPEEWSTRDVIHHLADSEMAAAFRLRHIVAEETPNIVPFDQDALVRAHSWPGRPIAASLRTFAATRDSTAEILEHMTDADWARAGNHLAIGHYPLESWLRLFAPHAHDHAEQIRAARAIAR